MEGSRTDREFNVLFLCTGNSARSIMAECVIGRWGKGKFRGFSAGSYPRGNLHPMTLGLLRDLDYETSGLRSKSWDEFAHPVAPHLDFVLTVCDQAAGEVCPIWPGHPITAHWGASDPAAFVGTKDAQRKFFMRIYLELESRIKMLATLPIDSLDRMTLEARMREIGKMRLPECQ
jgi:protein-tyrosine-phosphatase